CLLEGKVPDIAAAGDDLDRVGDRGIQIGAHVGELVGYRGLGKVQVHGFLIHTVEVNVGFACVGRKHGAPVDFGAVKLVLDLLICHSGHAGAALVVVFVLFRKPSVPAIFHAGIVGAQDHGDATFQPVARCRVGQIVVGAVGRE